MGGMIVGLKDPHLLFNPDCPYTGCRVCGAVFQSELDREISKWGSMYQAYKAMLERKAWSIKHAKTHTDKEHLSLARSGMMCTPEAAAKFASFGIIAISDMVLNDETADAMANARSIPIDDVEGGSSIVL